MNIPFKLSGVARPDAWAFSPATYALCGAGIVAMHGLDWAFGFRTDTFTLEQVGLIVIICALLRSHHLLRRAPRLALTIDAILLAGLIADFALTFPWQVQAFALPLRDEAVHGFDLALGFDHARYLTFLNAHPLLVTILTAAYKTFVPQILLLVLALLYKGQIHELDRYFLAFLSAIALTSAISALVPTAGVVVFLDPRLAQTIGWPHAATDVAAYLKLRDGSLRELVGIPVLGIISFPSFHAASGVLVTWSVRSFKLLRLPVLALNCVMLVATVGCGGHYVADVLCACGVAAASIAFARFASHYGYAVAWAVLARSRNAVIALVFRGAVARRPAGGREIIQST